MLHSQVLIGLLHAYGYLALAVIVGLESLGLPLPGEGLLIAASLFAGTTQEMNPYMVIASAALGAIGGQLAGYWIGRGLGSRVLRRYGPRLGLPVRRLALGRLLFRRHGVKLVFVGRFIIVVRTIGALLAGANAMSSWRFMVANVAGSVAWASAYGIGVSELGKSMSNVAGPVGVAIGLAAAVLALLGWLVMRRQEKRMMESPARLRRLAAAELTTRAG